MTPSEAKNLLALAEMGGCRPPEAVLRNVAVAASMWAEEFTAAGADYATAATALRAYLAEPQADAYPKPWPSVGHILARTPGARERRAAIAEGGVWMQRVQTARGGIGGETERPWTFELFTRLERQHGPVSEPIRQAIEDGIAALGGWRRLGMAREDDTGNRRAWDRAWTDALTSARIEHQAQLPSPALRAIPAGK